MKMKELKLNEFIEKLASKDAVPGGGSVAALSASLGTSLIEMVANLTIGKKKYLQVNDEMQKIIEQTKPARNDFLEDIQKDSQSFQNVLDCFKLPKTTEKEKEYRKERIQKAYKKAIEVPLNIAEKALELFDTAEFVVKNGNKNAESDGLVAAIMLRSSILSALLNVKINLSGIKDEEYREKMEKKVEFIEDTANKREKEILKLSKI
jgi:formiminotetrahydrofolate cyclodeaminase